MLAEPHLNEMRWRVLSPTGRQHIKRLFVMRRGVGVPARVLTTPSRLAGFSTVGNSGVTVADAKMKAVSDEDEFWLTSYGHHRQQQCFYGVAGAQNKTSIVSRGVQSDRNYRRGLPARRPTVRRGG